MDTCGKCRFFTDAQGHWVPSHTYCRRYAPRPVVVIADRTDGDLKQLNVDWPEVDAVTPACGEYVKEKSNGRSS